MKNNRFLLAVLVGLAPLTALHGFTPDSAKARASVAFLEPETFTDVRDRPGGSDVERTGFLDRLREHLIKRTLRHIPEGQLLEITFTDIDLAGDFEPWAGPRWNDVRIVRDIYPPRMEFTFRLTDAEGNVLRQDQRRLVGLGFLTKITMAANDDPLRHEKALLDEWLREEFPAPRKPPAERLP